MIRHIVAVDDAYGIARVGTDQTQTGIPWDIPDDLHHFHDMTKRFGGHVLLGSGTMEVIGHALSARNTYLLTHNPELEVPDGVVVVTDLEQFLADMEAQRKDLWIAGGEAPYRATTPDEVYLTRVSGSYNCNRKYPEDTLETLRRVEQFPIFEQNGYSYQYELYRK